MSKYKVTCRVRNSMQGVDATATNHGPDELIEAPTAFGAFQKWLYNKDSWLTLSPEAFESLHDRWIDDDLSSLGWDSVADGKHDTDWETSDLICEPTKEDSVSMCGTANCSEFEFEVEVRLVSIQETCECTAPPTDLKNVKRESLAEIASWAQGMLFLHADEGSDDHTWSLDKEVSGADFIDHMTTILSKHGLVPRAASVE
jgi:hypothetical protein